MPFSDTTKQEARSKSGYACCICHQVSVSLEVHHIIPQEDNGPDTLDNAAPACPNCHSDFGANPEKIKRIKEMRDWWYKQVKNMYSSSETAQIKKISEDLSNINEKLPDLKETLNEFTKSWIQQITPKNAQMIASSIISGATASSVMATKLGDRVYANMKCGKCGTQIGLLVGTNNCPNCGNPI